jgi:hypothetical protein
MPPKRRYSQLSDSEDDEDGQSDSPNNWSESDEYHLRKTYFPELRLWRLAKSMYGVDAFQLVPNGERADFTSAVLIKLPNGDDVQNPNWNLSVAQQLITLLSCPVFSGEFGLECLHYAMKMAKYSRLLRAHNERAENEGVENEGEENEGAENEEAENERAEIVVPPEPVLPSGELHEDWAFLNCIQRATEIHIKEWDGAVAEEITFRDLESISVAWDLYRDDSKDVPLEPLKTLQTRLPRLPRGSGNEEALSWKKAAILRARTENISSPERGMPSNVDATPEQPRGPRPPPRRLRGLQLKRARSQRQPEQAEGSSAGGHQHQSSPSD